MEIAVPISYENRKLANCWVSNLGKSYNLKTAGRISKLTHDQIQQLHEFGFVWNHWDYQYQKKFEDTLGRRPWQDTMSSLCKDLYRVIMTTLERNDQHLASNSSICHGRREK
jgi:hypothetical protein